MEKTDVMFDLDFIAQFKNQNKPFFIAGTDEVGRGPLAGPVVGACAILEIKKYNEEEIINLLATLSDLGVTDSKKLNSKKRTSIIEKLGVTHPEKTLHSNEIYTISVSKNLTLKIYIQEIQASVIDEINILQASLLAMKESFMNLNSKIDNGIILIDGNKLFSLKDKKQIEIKSVIKGDLKSLIIGVASIFAKEYRDQLMIDFAKTYPEYGWDKNSGYPTKSHLDAILAFGITDHHRLTFKGVKEVYAERGISRS